MNTAYPKGRCKRTYSYAGAVFLLLLFLSYFSGCAAIPPAPLSEPFRPQLAGIQWRQLASGVETADIYDKSFPLIAHAVKVDLSHPAVSIVTSEAALFKNTDGRIIGETPQTFALRHNTVAAFNAAAFKTRSVLFSLYRTIVGIHITDFRRMSPPNARYGALLFYARGTACIIDSQKEDFFTADVRHAVSGFWVILRNGEIVPQKVQIRDSRTAVGLADNGKTLFILAVEGENKRKSQGLSYEETALLMRELGASDAMQLDGGSSSTLVIRENGEQRIVAPSIGLQPTLRTASNAGIVVKE